MALPIAAAGAAMIPGFFGGLGYGTGLQYSYARGFPAFETGGSKGFVDVVKRDATEMLRAFTQGMFGNETTPTSGVNKSGQTYQQWQRSSAPPTVKQPRASKPSPGANKNSTTKNTILNEIKSLDSWIQTWAKAKSIGNYVVSPTGSKMHSSVYSSTMKRKIADLAKARNTFHKKYGYWA